MSKPALRNNIPSREGGAASIGECAAANVRFGSSAVAESLGGKLTLTASKINLVGSTFGKHTYRPQDERRDENTNQRRAEFCNENK